MKTPQEIQSGLGNFSGSMTFTPYPLWGKGFVLTEGARYIADECGAWWLIDLIGGETHGRMRAEDFVTCKLLVNENKAVIEWGDGNNPKYKHQISFTDFPLPEVTLWAVRNETGNYTVMLPSEY